ncbi:MAG: crossover junction endodeoxyribonuclease RuvC [Chloroflexi bacterium]|nr:MAG: crossover junction endodeoxyribonuclease RuvC [Chloroflexota bacterium]
MRVLGVDPGLARTGIALVDGVPGRLSLVHAACLETAPQTSDAARFVNLMDLVLDACASLQPEVAAVEQLYFSTNRRTAMRVSEARGVILCALGRAGVDIAEYNPVQVKEAVCGYGAARKPQVSRMTVQLLHLREAPDPDDVADACAVAICHHHRVRISSLSPRRQTAAPSRLDAAVAAARARLARASR